MPKYHEPASFDVNGESGCVAPRKIAVVATKPISAGRTSNHPSFVTPGT